MANSKDVREVKDEKISINESQIIYILEQFLKLERLTEVQRKAIQTLLTQWQSTDIKTTEDVNKTLTDFYVVYWELYTSNTQALLNTAREQDFYTKFIRQRCVDYSDRQWQHTQIKSSDKKLLQHRFHSSLLLDPTVRHAYYRAQRPLTAETVEREIKQYDKELAELHNLMGDYQEKLGRNKEEADQFKREIDVFNIAMPWYQSYRLLLQDWQAEDALSYLPIVKKYKQQFENFVVEKLGAPVLKEIVGYDLFRYASTSHKYAVEIQHLLPKLTEVEASLEEFQNFERDRKKLTEENGQVFIATERKREHWLNSTLPELSLKELEAHFMTAFKQITQMVEEIYTSKMTELLTKAANWRDSKELELFSKLNMDPVLKAELLDFLTNLDALVPKKNKEAKEDEALQKSKSQIKKHCPNIASLDALSKKFDAYFTFLEKRIENKLRDKYSFFVKKLRHPEQIPQTPFKDFPVFTTPAQRKNF